MTRAYLDQLLAIDAAVIADNATHIVVAVRIDKCSIAKNHQLLVALSTLAADQTPANVSATQVQRRLRSGSILQLMRGRLLALLQHPLTLALNWFVTIPALIF